MPTDQPTGFAEGGYDPADDPFTASERARGLIMTSLNLLPDAACGAADDAVSTLLAHPDLLVDLAIEAGEPEQFRLQGASGPKWIGEPVYHRTPTEANDGD